MQGKLDLVLRIGCHQVVTQVECNVSQVECNFSAFRRGGVSHPLHLSPVFASWRGPRTSQSTCRRAGDKSCLHQTALSGWTFTLFRGTFFIYCGSDWLWRTNAPSGLHRATKVYLTLRLIAFSSFLLSHQNSRLMSVLLLASFF